MDALLILLALYLVAGPLFLLLMTLTALDRGRQAKEQAEQLRKSVDGLRAQLAWVERRQRSQAGAGGQDGEADAQVPTDPETVPPAVPDGTDAEPAPATTIFPDPAPAPAVPVAVAVEAAMPSVAPAARSQPDSWRGALEAAKQPPASPPPHAPVASRDPAPTEAPSPRPAPPPLPGKPSPAPESIPWGRLLDAFGLQPPRPGEVGEAVAAAWWVTRIGMLLGIIAAVFFGVYVSQTTGPWLRLAQLLAVAITVTGVGLWQERTLARFGQVLTGGGLALLFFTCYGAAALPALKVIDNALVGTMVQMLGVAGILGFALWRRSEPVGTMAIGFGYVACWFAQAHGLQPWSLGGLLVLALTACVLQARFHWHTARAVALAGSYTGMALLVMLVWPQDPPDAGTLLGWLLALAAVLGISCQRSLIPRATGVPGSVPPFAAGWCLLNSSAASALGLLAFVRFHPDHAGWFFLSFTLLWLALAWRLKATVPDEEQARGAAAAVFPALILKASALLCLWIIDTLGGSLQAPAVALQGFGLLWLLRRERSIWLPLAMAVLLTVVMPWLAWLEWHPVAVRFAWGGNPPLPPWPQPAHLGGLAAALLALTVLTLAQRWRLLDHLPEPSRRGWLIWARFVFGLMLAATILLPWQGNGQGFALLAVVLALAGIAFKAGAGRCLDPLPTAAIAWAPVYLLIWGGSLGDLHQWSSLALAAAALLMLLGAHAALRTVAATGADAAADDRLRAPGLALSAMAMVTIWQPLWWTVSNSPGPPGIQTLWWLGAMILTVLVLGRQLPRPESSEDGSNPEAWEPRKGVISGVAVVALLPWGLAWALAVVTHAVAHLPWLLAIGAALALPLILAGARPLWWTSMALLLTAFGTQWQALALRAADPGSLILWLNPVLLTGVALAAVVIAGRDRPTVAMPPDVTRPEVFDPPWLLQAVLHLAMMVTFTQLARWHFDPAGQLAVAVAVALLWLALDRLGRPRRWLATAAAPLAVLLTAGFHAFEGFAEAPHALLFGQGGRASAVEIGVAAVAALLLPLLLPAARGRLLAWLRPGHLRSDAEVDRNGHDWLAAIAVGSGWWLAAVTLFTPGWVSLGLALAALAAALCRRLVRASSLEVLSLDVVTVVFSIAALPEAMHALGSPSHGHGWLAVLLTAATLAATGAVMLRPAGQAGSSPTALPAELSAERFRKLSAWLHALAALGLAFIAWVHAPGPFDQAVTICWGASAGLLWLLGLAVRLRAYRMTGLIGFAACVVRMFAVDIHEVIERIIAFAVVAVVLLLTGYLYSRLRHWVDPPDLVEPDDPKPPPASSTNPAPE